MKPTIETALDGAPAGLINYANSTIGIYEGLFGKKQTIRTTYTVPVPPYQTVKSVTLKYEGAKTTYTFGYDGTTYPAVDVTALKTYSFSTQYIPNHGHGHGHGHGGDLNAGGGIFE